MYSTELVQGSAMVLSFEASPFWREMMYGNIVAASGDMCFGKELKYRYFGKELNYTVLLEEADKQSLSALQQFMASRNVEAL